MITEKDGIVYRDDKAIGTIRKSCCGGYDYKPNKGKGMFWLMKPKDKRERVKMITQIETLKLPKKYFFWNFKLMNEEQLSNYQKSLLEI